MDRRTALKGMAAGVAATATPIISKAAAHVALSDSRLYSTTQTRRWAQTAAPALGALGPSFFRRSFTVELNKPQQAIEGFGGAFSELGWDALQTLSPALRAEALDALFGGGANFSLCRTPIGANDITKDFYSYDEVAGDFALTHFSIDKDKSSLIPFIHEAQRRNPALNIWASPWSPPTWMKKNGMYAQGTPWPGGRPNGVTPDKVMHEGQDGFIQEDRYFAAYALYFRRYIEAYRQQGIKISLVMPQNEFNSPHPFPGCAWTAQGLARFIPFLHKEVGPLGVRLFLGTLERNKPEVIDHVLADPVAGPLLEGVGVQWAGKEALTTIHERHPNMKIWSSEQECGVGTNDWRYARYGWRTMLRYFRAGTSAWQYWNMVMPTGGMSGWGWPQNSLVVVDPKQGTYRLSHDYWVLRHLSAFVQPGARFLPCMAGFGYENQLAFRNPDGSLVLAIHNDLAESDQLEIGLGKQQISIELPADSFNTLVIPASQINPTG